MKRVVLTGAESTGKSTLAAALATRFGTVWAPEYLRTFVDLKGAIPAENDVYAIAHGHLAQAADCAVRARQVLFLDTDLVTTCVYQRIYFGHCPSVIERAARERAGDLYLLTEPDIPWVPDPGQREGPESRARTHRKLLAELRRLDLRVVRIRGSRNHRLNVAAEAVDQLLKRQELRT